MSSMAFLISPILRLWKVFWRTRSPCRSAALRVRGWERHGRACAFRHAPSHGSTQAGTARNPQSASAARPGGRAAGQAAAGIDLDALDLDLGGRHRGALSLLPRFQRKPHLRL